VATMRRPDAREEAGLVPHRRLSRDRNAGSFGFGIDRLKSPA
jgi:hypothetical protein